MEVAVGASRRRWAGYAFVMLGGVLLALMFGRGERHPHESLVARKARKALPLLTLRLLDGGVFRLVDHRGQVVVINYWASWRSPCWNEASLLMGVSRDMAPKDFALVGVAMDEGSPEYVARSVRHFVQALQITYPIALPQPMSQMSYGMQGLPTTLLVDRNGALAKTYVGALRETDLRDDIGALLKEDTH